MIYNNNTNRVIFRKMRRELSRFPNVDVVEQIQLGKVGFYNGRDACFDWKTTLNDLDIDTHLEEFNDEPPVGDELYTSYNAVKYGFGLIEGV